LDGIVTSRLLGNYARQMPDRPTKQPTIQLCHSVNRVVETYSKVYFFNVSLASHSQETISHSGHEISENAITRRGCGEVQARWGGVHQTDWLDEICHQAG